MKKRGFNKEIVDASISFKYASIDLKKTIFQGWPDPSLVIWFNTALIKSKP